MILLQAAAGVFIVGLLALLVAHIADVRNDMRGL
jgi:hypothetical protein